VTSRDNSHILGDVGRILQLELDGAAQPTISAGPLSQYAQV